MSKVSIKGNASGTGNFTIEAPNSNTDRTLNLPDDSGTLLYKDTNGNVGIGETNPLALLHIRGEIDQAETQKVYLTETAGDGGFWKVDGTNNTVFFGGLQSQGENVAIEFPRTANSFKIKTNSSDALNIDSSQNLAFNSGFGSVATAYGCRAWVNFNGEGTVSIRASGNVSSITDNGTGDYTVNFTTSMPDANYAAYGKSLNGNAGPTGLDADEEYFSIARSYTTNSFKIGLRTDVSTGFGSVDSIQNTYAVFR